jgi:hypothetical protein
VVNATRTVEHTHQAEKIDALRNAVLNSVATDAPDADTQTIIMNLIDRFTPSHLRLATLWDDPPGWFASHGIPQPQAAFRPGGGHGVTANRRAHHPGSERGDRHV